MGIYSALDYYLSVRTYPWGISGLVDVPNGSDGWSGKIITVGSGRDYTDINAAYSAAGEGDMLIVYPGSYTPNTRWNKKLFIRGAGSSIGDVVIADSENATGANTGADLFFEWVKFDSDTDWRSNYYINSSEVVCEFNKCYFDVSATNSHAISCTDKSPSLIFRNCRMDEGYNTIARLNRSNTRIIKCYTPSYSCWSCTGSFIEEDRVTSAATNYGYEYGDFVFPL